MNTVERHSHFFQCAQQVAMTYAKPSQKIVFYLITDSAHLRRDAVRAYPTSVVVSGLAQKHNELGGQEQRKAQLEEDRATDELFDLEEVMEDADGLMNTLAETWWVIAEASVLSSPLTTTFDCFAGHSPVSFAGTLYQTFSFFPSLLSSISGRLSSHCLVWQGRTSKS